MTMVKGAIAVFWVFGFPTLWSRTSMVKLVVTAFVVGIPEMTPNLLSLSPFGSDPMRFQL